MHFHFDDGASAQKLDIPALLSAPGPGVHLYVCGPKGFMDAALGSARAVASGSSRLNRIGEQVLGSLKQRGAAEVRFDDEGRTVLATRIQHTGWVLVLIRSGGLAGTK